MMTRERIYGAASFPALLVLVLVLGGAMAPAQAARNMANRPPVTVTYSTNGPGNQAPDQPTLVWPTDGATDVSVPPTLEVTVSDADEDTLGVTFYGRAVDAGTGEDFTLVVLPDTQNMSQYYPAAFTSMTQWIADNKTSQNIVFATHVGDIVNTANGTAQWNNADAAMDLLDPPNVFYSVGPGNHDLPIYTATSLYPAYFGISRFSGKSYYGGAHDSDNYNNYSLFSASGMDFILINLQYNPTTAMLDWADALLKANAERRGIVESHNMLNINDSWSNQGIYTALKDNPTLFLMLCGHMHSGTDGAAYRAETGDYGQTIHIMLADYQDYPNGGNGYLRILRFSPVDDLIYATTYSPYIDAYITTSPDQMQMAYDMVSGGAAFEVIGTVNDVVSGNNASITWPDLDAVTEYEWHVDVSDGSETTNGPTWHFTTQLTTITHDLTIAVDPVGGGTSDPTAGVHPYSEGEIVPITATPADGYVFDHWEGDVADPDSAGTTVTMDEDQAVTAHFSLAPSLLGDVNGDDAVDSTDALIDLSCDAGIDTPQFCPMNCGDVNGDGLVNSTDALITLSHDVGMTVPYPVGQPGCPSIVTPCPGCTP